MAITAKSNTTPRELIPADNYVARCYQMLEIGTVKELFQGEEKVMTKVRIGWELPLFTKVFKEENGEQPHVFSAEYTLSMTDKANLRKLLTSWRGTAFTDEEAKAFDITKLIGAPCLLNIIHKPSKSDPSKVYEQIAGITKLPKGMTCPPAVTPPFILSYDAWDEKKFESLPDFIRDKMKTSMEYKAMKNPVATMVDDKGQPLDQVDDFDPFADPANDGDGLPF